MAKAAGGKNKKQGRSKKSPQNLRYINERRHAKSHVKRIEKHLKKFPDDPIAKEALVKWKRAA
ncbi:hypothetical protein [Pseudolabrys sp.]|uniref:hypothetical protein n=1 Tax=Pseudolabrys sp. TaxID=1960880 RepID=UPI003D0B7F69